VLQEVAEAVVASEVVIEVVVVAASEVAVAVASVAAVEVFSLF
jgi:hypothetical protein